MSSKSSSIIGLILLLLSQILLSFGYEFLMSQKPIDFAHWSLLLSVVLLFSLWFSLPVNITKWIGLSIMSLGIAGVIGMCMIDFILWSYGDNQEGRNALYQHIVSNPGIRIPFLVLGPACFYAGMCIATYGLFNRYRWQVITLNIGGLLIGLGFMVFHNHSIPAIGAVLFTAGMGHLIYTSKSV